MRNLFGTTWVVAAFALSAAAAGPEEWARRADVEIARVASTDHSALFSAGDLAVAAYASSPTDARRETAGRVIRKIADASVASAKNDSDQSSALLHAAVLLNSRARFCAGLRRV
jgi:hypothetical protein